MACPILTPSLPVRRVDVCVAIAELGTSINPATKFSHNYSVPISFVDSAVSESDHVPTVSHTEPQ